MKIGLQIPNFTFPGGPRTLATDLANIAETAEQSGFDMVAVMDHFFQIGPVGPEDMDMLEAYTTLGYLAAHTERARLLTLITGALYRHPSVLAKTVSTLDVLSGGRAMLGVGAGWNESESRGLGIPFPSTRERFELLEDALDVFLAMCAESEQPVQGKHVDVPRPMNVPQTLSRPHPPIMVGGGGERKTLRYVARYAQACNLFPNAELSHKLDVLRAHCDDVGRDYDEIEKTVIYQFDASKPDDILADLRRFADLGVHTALGMVHGVHELEPLRTIGSRVIPAAAEL